MVSFEHKRLIERLAGMDEVPGDESEVASWMRGDKHLKLLRDDARGSELMVAGFTAVPRPTCLNSYIVPMNLPKLQEGTLSFAGWSPNPYHGSAARYSWGRGSDGVKPSFEIRGMGGQLPSEGSSLVFFRSAEGVGHVSREVAQDFVHVSGIFWHRERKAYSKLDHRGDWLDVVSQSSRDDSAPVDLITVHRETLDLHLVAVSAVLVRVFEFDLSRVPLGRHFDFDRSIKRVTTREADLQYRELFIEGQLNRIRGAQVIRPRLTPEQVEQLVVDGRIIDPSKSEPVEFIVYDMRNRRVTTVTTDPSSTTNYFEAAKNQLPYETSPAFFRSEVLSKYRADRDKYDMSDGWIVCRGAWVLRNYSINDAGQVAAYICYLRELPYEEQIYWKAFNEEPKSGLSRRAFQNDFLGKWAEEAAPLEKLELLLDKWESDEVEWWKPPEDLAHRRLAVPYGDSRDEWARALGALSNVVLEGFRIQTIREALTDSDLRFSKDERSISLLERLLQAHDVIRGDMRLEALREVNQLRNLGGSAHRVGSKGRMATGDALEQHGSYAAHYEHLCNGLGKELALVDRVLGGPDGD